MRWMRPQTPTVSHWVSVAASLVLATSHTAWAAEPTSELPAGGLVYAGGMALLTEREDIVIAPSRVLASYIVRNAADEARTTLLAFALPEVDMLAIDGAPVENAAYDPQNPSNYVAFSASVDGQPAEMFGQSNALAMSLVDVTSLLKSHAIPLYPYDPAVIERLNSLTEPIRTDLVNRSLARMSDGQLEPLWTLKSTLFWQQTFAVGQVRTITISYQPVAGSSSWTADTAPALMQRYCVPAGVAEALTARVASGEPAVVKWVHYLSYAGAGARGSIGQYRVAVQTPPNIRAYSCVAALSSTAGKAGELVLANHVAEGEVQVLFVE